MTIEEYDIKNCCISIDGFKKNSRIKSFVISRTDYVSASIRVVCLRVSGVVMQRNMGCNEDGSCFALCKKPVEDCCKLFGSCLGFGKSICPACTGRIVLISYNVDKIMLELIKSGIIKDRRIIKVVVTLYGNDISLIVIRERIRNDVLYSVICIRCAVLVVIGAFIVTAENKSVGFLAAVNQRIVYHLSKVRFNQITRLAVLEVRRGENGCISITCP